MSVLDLSTATPSAPTSAVLQADPPAIQLGAAELVALVRGYADHPARWQPLVRFSGTRRWWTQLQVSDVADVWLLSWLTDQTTELHDHGGSSAAFTVVQGVLEESRGRHDGSLLSTRLAPGPVQWVDPLVIHDVRNTDPAPAVSIHAYSPPLTTMRYYRRSAAGLELDRTEQGREPEKS